MTLADRLGWTDIRFYIPAAFTITAFAIGVQIKLVTDAFGPLPYPPPGQGLLGWSTLSVLVASAALHVPWRRWPEARDELVAVTDRLKDRGKAAMPETEDAAPAGATGQTRTNGHTTPEVPEDVPRLKARVHSPIQSAPVVAPSEDVEITVEAEPAELAEDLEIEIESESTSGKQTAKPQMAGTQITHVVAFDEPGRFSITVRLDHPRSEPASQTFTGRVATYREEVGRIFEEVKQRGAKADLDMGPQSTPREVCRELGKLDGAEASDLADLAVELEVALYGDEEVDRATYETVYHAIEALDLPHEDPREVAP